MICSGVWRFLLIYIPSRIGRSYRKNIENPLFQHGPVLRGEVSWGCITSVQVRGKWCYIGASGLGTNGHEGTTIVDVEDPSNPKVVGVP